METWPTSLRVLVQVLLHSRHPMFLWWGPELTQFYNDAYVPSFGEGKHPAAMGEGGRECWQESWPIIGPQVEAVMRDGSPTWQEDALVPIWRNGRIEEVFWTYGYSPAFGDDGRIAGTLVVCTETTSGVLANRRLQLAATVAERAGRAAAPEEVLDFVFPCFKDCAADIPFAAVFDGQGRLLQHTEIVEPGITQLTALGQELWPAPLSVGSEPALDGQGVQALTTPIAARPWPEPVREVFCVRLADGSNTLIVFGLSPRLPFDPAYRGFLIQLTKSIVTSRERVQAIANRAHVVAERRDLLAQAPIPTAILTGPELRYELANEHFVAMVGREVIGKTYVEAFPEVEGTPLLEAVRQVYREGLPLSAEEMCIPLDRQGNGQVEDVFFKFSLQPIRESGGAVYGMMVVALDVTEMVLARRTQEQAHAALERAYHERAALVAQLEAVNRTKDEFMAILGHELRNPLAPIVSALELIRLRTDGKLSREHALIERQVQHLVRLVEDLLDVARIAQGKVDLKQAANEIGAIVSNAVEMAESLLAQGKHHLTVHIPEPIPWYGDATRLAQVVANLLTNAARYTPPRGDIRVSAVRDPGGGIRIRVVDDGAGIEQDALQHIFEMFAQGPRGPDRAEGGLGLGLTLVKSLVEMHGGTVEAKSEGAGRGSAFEVWLPHRGQPSTPPMSDGVAVMSSKRILVVDDNEDAAEMLARMLTHRGHQVVVAHDGASALELLPQHRPQIGILDIGLPVMDGYELAEKILELTIGDICLVAITGYGQAQDQARCMEAGFAAHLVKPVPIELLCKTMARLVDTD